MALTPPQGGNPNPPSIATPMQPQIPTPPRQQPLMQPSPLGQQAQAYSPFSNQTNNNASASPFNQSNQPQAAAGQAGFKAPTFTGPVGGDASKALIQSQNNLIQAINKLTQGIGNIGKGTTGGTPGAAAGTATNANPSNTTTAAAVTNQTNQTQQSNFRQNLNEFGKSIIQGVPGTFSNFASASTIADIVKTIPFIGPIKAVGYQLAASKASSVANLQQLNRDVSLSSGILSGSNINQNTDLRNFTRMGISPSDAMQMQIQAGNAGFGRFSTFGPNSALAFGANLSQFVRRGFGATTAGLTAAISDVNLNPAAMNANNIFAQGANLGMNDVTMQSTLQSVLGIQRSTALQGGKLNTRGVEGILATLLPTKGAFAGEFAANTIGGMAGIGRFENPYGDYANQIIQSEARKFAPGDYFKQAQFLEELKGDPTRKFKLLEGRVGERRAKEILAGQEGLTTQGILAIQNAANMPALSIKSPFEGLDMKMKGVGLASDLSRYELDDITKFGNKIRAVSKANRRIEENQLKNLNTDQGAIDKLVATAETANNIASKGFDTMIDALNRLAAGAEALSKLDFSAEGLGNIITGAIDTAIEKLTPVNFSLNPSNWFGTK